MYLSGALVLVFLTTYCCGHGGRLGNFNKRKNGFQDRLVDKACEVIREGNPDATTQPCPEDQTCSQGPVTLKINDTQVTAKYCSDYSWLVGRLNHLPFGTCRVEQDGEVVYNKSCLRNGQSCEYGPQNIVYNDDAAQAFTCFDPAARPDFSRFNFQGTGEPRGRRFGKGEGRQNTNEQGEGQQNANEQGEGQQNANEQGEGQQNANEQDGGQQATRDGRRFPGHFGQRFGHRRFGDSKESTTENTPAEV